MKARKVKGLDPDGPLGDNARRIIDVRLAELESFGAAVRDPRDVTALHNMRIAAKRLRYVLELTAPALGASAEEGARVAKRLQDLLGEIHDCDEAIPMVERHVERLRAEDVATVRERASGEKDLDPRLVAEAPHRRRYRGLAALDTYLRARRDVLYERFIEQWSQLEHGGLRERMLGVLAP